VFWSLRKTMRVFRQRFEPNTLWLVVTNITTCASLLCDVPCRYGEHFQYLHHWELMLWLMRSSLYMYCSYFYCTKPILLLVNGSVGNWQLPIPQYQYCSQCCLTWKNPGCHWALILLYVDFNGCLFMTVLHWIMLLFRF